MLDENINLVVQINAAERNFKIEKNTSEEKILLLLKIMKVKKIYSK